jgi:hypothetical protein
MHDEPQDKDKPEPTRKPGELTEAELSEVSGGSPSPPEITHRVPSPPQI